MDRGLAIVLTILTGAALGLVEACSGAVDDPHPPVADNQGAIVLPGVVGGGSGGGRTGTTTGSSSGTNGTTSGGTNGTTDSGTSGTTSGGINGAAGSADGG